MYICIYMYSCIYIYTCICTYTCIFIYTCIYTYTYIHIYTYVYIHLYIHVYINIQICIHISIYMYIYICIGWRRLVQEPTYGDFLHKKTCRAHFKRTLHIDSFLTKSIQIGLMFTWAVFVYGCLQSVASLYVCTYICMHMLIF